MEMRLPEDVAYIIKTLEHAGFEAYAVGGCVRDTLLGRQPQDWDITTSAKPMQVKALFRRTIDTGLQHGTVTVLLHHVGYEVTTYRIDGEYKDNRHPESVEFTEKLIYDLERRDFTINAMAYNPGRGLVDEFDGVGDMERKIIRCVGNPGARFDEDALRMLRAVRFSGQLGFSIEENTRQAIVERAERLKNISAERIRVELTKLLTAKDAGQLREAHHLGMTAVFLPELDRMMKTEQKNPHHIYTVGEHSVHGIEVMNFFFGNYGGKWKIDFVPPEILEETAKLTEEMGKKEHLLLCLAMLFHDIGKPESMTVDEKGVGHFYGHPQASERLTGQIMRRLTFDNDSIHMVKRLVRWHDYRFGQNEKAMRRAMAKIGKDLIPLLFLVRFSDIFAQNPDTFGEKLDRVTESIALWRRVQEKCPALQIRDLAVDGNDLIKLGIRPGPELGGILQELLEMVLDTPEKNQADILLGYARSHYLGTVK